MNENMDELERKMRMLLGLKPYNSPANYCYNDNYFARSIQNEFGEIAMRKMRRKLQQEKDNANN